MCKISRESKQTFFRESLTFHLFYYLFGFGEFVSDTVDKVSHEIFQSSKTWKIVLNNFQICFENLKVKLSFKQIPKAHILLGKVISLSG